VTGFLFCWWTFPSPRILISIPPLEEIRGNTEASKQWLLADLSVVDGYRATVASDNSYSHPETYAGN
jgi:hypothetical protein